MKIVKNSPSFIRLEDIPAADLPILKSVLFYKNLSTQYLYQQAKKNKFQYNRDPDGWHNYVLKLKSQIDRSALFQDDDGYYTYSGLLTKLKGLQLVESYTDNVIPPSPKPMAWELNYKPLKMYNYQIEAVETLLKNHHASVELPTASGKSEVIKNLIKNMGLNTLVIVPFTAIANTLYDDFVKAFGKKYIGLYGDGKKQLGKRITIAISASLTKLTKDDKAWEEFSKKDVLIADESHLISAPTLSDILLNLCKDVPYRWSVSATQLRNDGCDILLEGLIGDIVYRKEFKELVAGGYLAPLKFRVFNVNSNSTYSGTNPLKVKQEHYLYNPQVLQLAAEVANMRVQMGESVLILIDELDQIDYLKPFLNVKYDIASSQTDVFEKIEAFNRKEITLLIGTSAVSTGANLKPTETLIMLIGGKSEIKIKQSLGRATRLYPGKVACQIIDFNVENNYQLANHFNERLNIYQTLSDDIQFINEFD